MDTKKLFQSFCLSAIRSVQAAKDSGKEFNYGMAYGFVSACDEMIAKKIVSLSLAEERRFTEVKAAVTKARERDVDLTLAPDSII